MRIIAVALLLLLDSSIARGADSATQPVDVTPQVEASVSRGLDWLARQQQPDGSIGADGPKLATTGLSLMAFLAAGHSPDVGKHGAVVRNTIDFLVKECPDDGYFGKVDGSRMYGQGICTLALAEAYGAGGGDEAQRGKLRDALQRAMKVILVAQTMQKQDVFSGGWRYEPQSNDSDLSLSGWNALALRGAQNAGLNVPKEPIGRAVGFVLKCYRADQKGFCYQPGQSATVAMTGVGILNLCLLDAADRKEVVDAGKFLVENPINDGTQFPYYSAYYSTQAAFQIGDPVWPTVWKLVRDRLLSQQEATGAFKQSVSSQEPGRTYATAMSCLTLSVPMRLLPVYQR